MRHAIYVAAAVLSFAAVVHAQPPAAGQQLGLAASIQRSYNTIKMNLTQAADKLGEADYSFKVGTMPETRTFGQLFAHVVQSQSNTCAAVRGTNNPFQGRSLEQELKTKADIVKALADSFALCDEAYTSLTDQNTQEMVSLGRGQIARAAALANNVSHNNEMYGTAAAYLRAKGLVPPSTERQMQGRGVPRLELTLPTRGAAPGTIMLPPAGR